MSFPDWVERISTLLQLPGAHPLAHGAAPDSSQDELLIQEYLKALRTRAQVRGARDAGTIALREFAAACRHDAELTSIGLPPEPGGVPVVSRSEELGDIRFLCVLGMLEGMFPRRRSEDCVLTDPEREWINRQRSGSAALGTSFDSARAERDEFARVCGAPTQGIAFFYPQTDDDRDNVPAFYLEEVKRALGGAVELIDYPRNQLAPPVRECSIDSDSRLRAALDEESTAPRTHRLQTPAAEAALKLVEGEALSPNDLREAALCPFRFAMSRRLSVHPNRLETAADALRRLPRKAALYACADPAEASRRLRAVLDEELLRLEGTVSRAELNLLRFAGRRQIREWVQREFRARELWPKEGKSLQLEPEFGSNGLVAELPLQGKKVRLKGRAAALSSMGDYAVVHLSGARRSLSDAQDAEHLEDPDALELGLYLWSASGTKPGTAVEVESALGDRTLYLLPRLASYPVQARPAEGLRVVDLGEKREFFTRVKRTLARAMEAASRAQVEPCPGEHCKFCDFGELCRSAQGYGEEESVLEPTDASSN